MHGPIWLFPRPRLQNQFMEGVGTHLIGLPVDSLNLKFIPKDELFFAKTVIQVGHGGAVGAIKIETHCLVFTMV